MKTIQFKILDSFPLESLETKTLLLNIKKMFIAATTSDLENFFKYHPEMSEIMTKIGGWDD
jgi:hypothetical protein